MQSFLKHLVDETGKKEAFKLEMQAKREIADQETPECKLYETAILSSSENLIQNQYTNEYYWRNGNNEKELLLSDDEIKMVPSISITKYGTIIHHTYHK